MHSEFVVKKINKSTHKQLWSLVTSYVFHVVFQTAMQTNSALSSWVMRRWRAVFLWSTSLPVFPVSPSSRLRMASKSSSGSTTNHQHQTPVGAFKMWHVVLLYHIQCYFFYHRPTLFWHDVFFIFYVSCRAMDSALQESGWQSTAHPIQPWDYWLVKESAFLPHAHEQVHPLVPPSLCQAVPRLRLRLLQAAGAAGGCSTCPAGIN